MAPMKTLKTTFSPRERFAIWFHVTRNVNAANGREQDQIDDVYQTLCLEEFDQRAREAKLEQKTIDPDDFDDQGGDPHELARDELSYLLGVLVRPMTASLSLLLRPIRKRLERERDSAGVKAEPEE